jgi:release factor glutamine methyltransferase
MVASDISEEALAVAKENANLNGVSNRISFVKSDLFREIEGSFDIIASNPPYVARDEFAGLQKEVLMEPRPAIDGGDDGLDFYRRIAPQAIGHLKEGGFLVMEIGYGQARHVAEIIEASGLKFMGLVKDQYGIDRIISARNG